MSGDWPLCFHRRLDRRTCSDTRVVPQHIQMRRKIKGNTRRPVGNSEEVRVRNREFLANEVFVVAQMVIQISVARSQAASENLEKKLSHACNFVRSIVPLSGAKFLEGT